MKHLNYASHDTSEDLKSDQEGKQNGIHDTLDFCFCNLRISFSLLNFFKEGKSHTFKLKKRADLTVHAFLPPTPNFLQQNLKCRDIIYFSNASPSYMYYFNVLLLNKLESDIWKMWITDVWNVWIITFFVFIKA